MIECFLMNNIEEEYVPEYKNFVDWLSVIDCEDMSEVNIKIITPKEMRNFNKLYKNEDKVSDILAFPNAISFNCLLYTSPSPRDRQKSRMPSSA